MRYHFGSCTLDVEQRELRNGGQLLHIEPMVLDILEHLISHRDRVVSRDELIAGVWNRRFISDSTVSSRIADLRSAVDDNGRDQKVIRTYSRRGFRFVAPVREEHLASSRLQRSEAPKAIRGMDSQEESIASRLSIVVLPFTNLSGTSDEHVAEGLTSDLISALARSIRGCTVVARTTAYTFKGATVDAKDLSVRLGVRYVLEGSTRRTSKGIKVSAQLIDALNGGVQWADELHGTLGELASLCEQIATHLARRLSLALVELEVRRHGETTDADVADLVLRGRAAYYSLASSTDAYASHLASGRAHYASALQRAPDNVDALAGIALIELVEISIFRPANTGQRLQAIEATINTAVECDPRHAVGRYARAYLFSLTNRLDAAREEALLALSLDPSLIEVYQRLALIEIFSGSPRDALRWLDTCRLASPIDPNSIYRETTRAMAHFLLGDDVATVIISQRALDLGHRPPYVYAHLIAALAHLNQLNEARAIALEMRRQHPSLANISAIRRDSSSKHPQYQQLRERLYEGLSKAGLPVE